MELVNPWKTMKERVEAENYAVHLFWVHNALTIKYWQETGEHLTVTRHYRKVETPNGDRYVRRSDL